MYIREKEESLIFNNKKEIEKYYGRYFIDLDDLEREINEEEGKRVKFEIKESFNVEALEENETLEDDSHISRYFDTIDDALYFMNELFDDLGMYDANFVYAQISCIDFEYDEIKRICSKEKNNDIKFDSKKINNLEKLIRYYRK